MNFSSKFRTIKDVGKTSQIVGTKRRYLLLVVVIALAVIIASLISYSSRSDGTKYNMVTGEHARRPRDTILNLRASSNKERLLMIEFNLKLFLSSPPVVGMLKNTSFSTTPTEITEANASEFFRHDHSPIQFANGHSKGENFELATAIPFDVDNSHSDNSDDWIGADEMYELLQQFGINCYIVSSRNHLISKDGKTPRPKYHVYLPLAEPLSDSDKFVLYCRWCIETFHADPKVSLKSQKIFGYGDNPHSFVESWLEGHYIDEVLTDDVLAAVGQLPLSLHQIIPSKGVTQLSIGSQIPANGENILATWKRWVGSFLTRKMGNCFSKHLMAIILRECKTGTLKTVSRIFFQRHRHHSKITKASQFANCSLVRCMGTSARPVSPSLLNGIYMTAIRNRRSMSGLKANQRGLRYLMIFARSCSDTHFVPMEIN